MEVASGLVSVFLPSASGFEVHAISRERKSTFACSKSTKKELEAELRDVEQEIKELKGEG